MLTLATVLKYETDHQYLRIQSQKEYKSQASVQLSNKQHDFFKSLMVDGTALFS